MPLILLMLATAICGYLVFRDAQARGMNARGWTLLVMLTSMLCLPVYLILRRPRKIV